MTPKGRRPEEREQQKRREERREATTSVRSRSPKPKQQKAKQQPSSSGAQRSRGSPLPGFDVGKYNGNWKGATVDFFRSSSGAQRSRASPTRGRLCGFDVGKYGENFKGATVDFFRRLRHSDPEDPTFGTYHTVRDKEGLYHSTLRLSDKARAAARLKKIKYEGEAGRTKIEAELSAARVLWDDRRIQERAAKLPPSKKARKRKKACAENNARRNALRFGRPAMTGVARA
eukprot:s399_g24.t1